MSLERPDLSAAFTNKKAPVDRTAGLTGLLPAPRPRPSTSPSTTTPSTSRDEHPTPSAPVIQAAPEAETTSTTTKTVRPIRASKNPPVSESANVIANVAVYLEPDLLDLVKARRRSTGLTYDELVHTAFAATSDDQLRATFARTRASSDSAGMPARTRRPRGTAGIQIQLRLDAPQRTWLDDTRQRVDAPSRSALVAAVLRLHLTD